MLTNKSCNLVTHQAPFSVDACFVLAGRVFFCFPDGRTSCVKIMTTYSAFEAWWIN